MGIVLIVDTYDISSRAPLSRRGTLSETYLACRKQRNDYVIQKIDTDRWLIDQVGRLIMPSWLKHPTGSPSPSTSGKDNLRISLRISMGEKSPDLTRSWTSTPVACLYSSSSTCFTTKSKHKYQASSPDSCVCVYWLRLTKQLGVEVPSNSQSGLHLQTRSIWMWLIVYSPKSSSMSMSDNSHMRKLQWDTEFKPPQPRQNINGSCSTFIVISWSEGECLSKRHFHTPIDVISYKRRAILSYSMFRKGRIRWFAYIEPDSRLDQAALLSLIFDSPALHLVSRMKTWDLLASTRILQMSRSESWITSSSRFLSLNFFFRLSAKKCSRWSTLGPFRKANSHLVKIHVRSTLWNSPLIGSLGFFLLSNRWSCWSEIAWRRHPSAPTCYIYKYTTCVC